MIKQEEIQHKANRELLLFKGFLLLSVLLHIVFLCFDANFFFFKRDSILTEGSISVDLIALDTSPLKPEKEEKSVPMLPQVPKKFELESVKKPDEMVFEEKKAPIKEDPKLQIEKNKADEDLTKVSLERLIKEMKRQKEKDKASEKPTLLSKSLQERKKELQTNILHGTLTMGDGESGYRSVIKALIQKHYILPEVYELKHSDIKATVQLLVNQEGGIEKLTLVNSSQNPLFDQLALKTVENSAPFPPPPREELGSVMILDFETKNSGH